MNASTLTWSVLIAAALGAGWTWHERGAQAHHSCAMHGSGGVSLAVEPTSEAASSAIKPALDSSLFRESLSTLPSPPNDGPAVSLESFWREAGPVEADALEPLLAELEARLQLFNSMNAGYANKDRAALAESAQPSDAFFAQYAEVGLAETQFLIDECIAGRVRIAPFTPLPTSVLSEAESTAQLVPHLAAAGGIAYVARLEQDQHPTLFEQRRTVNALARAVALAGDAPVAASSR